MDISTIADQVYQFLKGVNSDTVNQVVSENMMIALIVTTVIGIFLSMFGLKMIRLWSALLGLVAGAGIGFAVTEWAFTASICYHFVFPDNRRKGIFQADKLQ